MFDYSHLETLLAVETEGTYEKAAKSLGVTRSAVSQQIRLLEERLGAVTISRKPAKTTRFGHRLCRHLEQVRFLETKLFLKHGDLFDFHDITPVEIKLEYHRGLLPTCFLDAVTEAADRQQAFILDACVPAHEASPATRAPEELKATLSSRSMPSDQVSRPLGVQRFRAVATPDFATTYFANGFSQSQASLAPSVSFDANTDLSGRFLEQLNITPRSQSQNFLPSNHGILNICLQGHAWALLPDPIIGSHITNRTLQDLCPAQSLDIEVYWHINKDLEQILPELTETVSAAAAKHLHPCADPEHPQN